MAINWPDLQKQLNEGALTKAAFIRLHNLNENTARKRLRITDDKKRTDLLPGDPDNDPCLSTVINTSQPAATGTLSRKRGNPARTARNFFPELPDPIAALLRELREQVENPELVEVVRSRYHELQAIYANEIDYQRAAYDSFLGRIHHNDPRYVEPDLDDKGNRINPFGRLSDALSASVGMGANTLGKLARVRAVDSKIAASVITLTSSLVREFRQFDEQARAEQREAERLRMIDEIYAAINRKEQPINALAGARLMERAGFAVPETLRLQAVEFLADGDANMPEISEEALEQGAIEYIQKQQQWDTEVKEKVRQLALEAEAEAQQNDESLADGHTAAEVVDPDELDNEDIIAIPCDVVVNNLPDEDD